MNRRNFFALTLSVATTALIAGCGGGGKESGRTTTFTPRGSGGVRGFVFRAADGALSLGYMASAPAGSVPAAGSTVVVGAISGVCGADGGFALDGIPTGQATLKVSGNGKTLNAPLTIIDGVSVQVGDPPISREKALDMVRAALAAEGLSKIASVYAPQQPLPATVSLGSSLGGELVEEPPLTEAQWLIYVDPLPSARFGHGVRFYLIDALTGSQTMRESNAWPMINRESYYSPESPVTTDTVQESFARVSRNHTLEKKFSNLQARTNRKENKKGKDYLLAFIGDERSDFDADGDRCGQIVKSKFFSGETLNVVTTSYGENIILGHPDLMQDIIQGEIDTAGAKTKPEDTLILYISSHGIINKNEKKDAPSGYFFAHKRNGKENRDNWSYNSAPVYAKDLNLDAINACHILIIVDTCYSGGWIDDVKEKYQSICKGKEIAILTAADNYHYSLGKQVGGPDVFITIDSQNIKVPPGGYVTSALIFAMNSTDSSGTLYEKISRIYPLVNEYLDKSVEFLIGLGEKVEFSNPQLWLREVDDSEPCPSGQQSVTVK